MMHSAAAPAHSHAASHSNSPTQSAATRTHPKSHELACTSHASSPSTASPPRGRSEFSVLTWDPHIGLEAGSTDELSPHAPPAYNATTYRFPSLHVMCHLQSRSTPVASSNNRQHQDKSSSTNDSTESGYSNSLINQVSIYCSCQISFLVLINLPPQIRDNSSFSTGPPALRRRSSKNIVKKTTKKVKVYRVIRNPRSAWALGKYKLRENIPSRQITTSKVLPEVIDLTESD